MRGGFEPPKASPADLQSAPFGRSGTSPQFQSALAARRDQNPKQAFILSTKKEGIQPLFLPAANSPIHPGRIRRSTHLSPCAPFPNRLIQNVVDGCRLAQPFLLCQGICDGQAQEEFISLREVRRHPCGRSSPRPAPSAVRHKTPASPARSASRAATG